jgi:hypothetical protein
VGPHAREPRQQVLELRQLDLHLGFARSRARGEDVEDQLGAIHDPAADGVFDVLALAGRQLVVEDDERRVRLENALAQLVDLAAAEVRPGIGPVDLLRDLPDDDGARGVGEVRQLAEVIVDSAAGAGPLARRPDEQRALDRRRDGDGFASYVRILVAK